MNQHSIAKALLERINSWPFRPADAKLESFGPGLPAIKLSFAGAAKMQKRYADGSEIFELPLAITLRARGGTPHESLFSLAEYLKSTEPPQLDDGVCLLMLEPLGPPRRTGADVSGLAEYTLPLRLMCAVPARPR